MVRSIGLMEEFGKDNGLKENNKELV